MEKEPEFINWMLEGRGFGTGAGHASLENKKTTRTESVSDLPDPDSYNPEIEIEWNGKKEQIILTNKKSK
ncbi:hypothetical protein JOC77_001583 [Peribacillus deserti]|uniref:Uncharacterized protein n=1 Tax=Peribacillus deserti TaxID=673318 RepID=A0ABS2QIN2_9BACI|nr:hypothetical protein [Peribacillus deserti]MBM7692156.1 hypothetical protein [Peribacillus deserti]